MGRLRGGPATHLALLGEDLLVVQPALPAHVAVGDGAQLRGGVPFAGLLRCPQVVQRLQGNKDTTLESPPHLTVGSLFGGGRVY